MRRRQPVVLLLAVVGLVSLSGASCPPRMGQPPPLTPPLPASPTLEQVIHAVNQNNSRIQSISTEQAEISTSDMLTALKGPLAFERPKRLRARVGTLVTGPELDLGSNDELFWIWIRRNPQQAVYYCRHDRFATSPIRRMIPIDPDWLIEALGINPFDPALPHQGPFVLKGGGLEIRTIRETPDGPTTKITVVDPTRGFIVGQYLLDPQGRLIANAIARQHRYDPVSGLSMARKIEINCPAAQFKMQLDLGAMQINRLSGNPNELWTIPRYEDYPLVDLSDPNLQWQPPPSASPPPTGQPPSGRPAVTSAGAYSPRRAWPRQ